MKRFKVEVSVAITDTFVVEGENAKQAECAAHNVMEAHLGYTRGGKMHYAAVSLGETEERPNTYVCSGCKTVLPKQAFGPGWLKCPLCGAPPVPVS